LRGLAGRFAQRRPPAAGDGGVEVALAVSGAVIEDKRVGAAVFTGTIRRLALHALEAELDTDLAALANVRLRLTYPAAGGESGDVYGKVTGAAPQGAMRLTRIHLTSVDAADQAVLARLVEAGAAPGPAAVVSNPTEAPR
jgi:hypothetical protein